MGGVRGWVRAHSGWIDARHLAAVGIVAALGVAAAALVIALNTADNSASKDDVASLQREVSAAKRSASQTAQTQAQSVSRELARLRSQLSEVTDAQAATKRGVTENQDQIASLRQSIASLRATASAAPAKSGAGAGAAPATAVPHGAAKTGTPATAAPSPPQTLHVSETEFKISPATPTVSGSQVTIDVKNNGKIPHNLAIKGPSGTEQLQNNLAPGASGTLTINLQKPGTYKWYCPIPGHEQQGMKGTITFK